MTFGYIVGSILIVVSVLIVLLVLAQQSRQAGLSGAIAGAGDTFFGKNKGRSNEAKLAKFTKIGGVVFFVLSLAATFVFAFMANK